VADTRHCEQCGDVFTPRREHARFCSARCRRTWNRAKVSDPADELSPLQWSITAMNEATGRLPGDEVTDPLRAFTTIAEAVWCVTIVDATLMRYHPQVYDRVMAGQPPRERALVEGTLAGLRFVRNRMGPEADLTDFTHRAAASNSCPGWRWKALPEPELWPLSPRGQAWELTRYRAYQANLADHTIGETFGRAAEFLNLTAAKAS
jgi:hypothetical protein